MLPAAVFLTALTFIWLLREKYANDRRLASFKYVVHVNGIRGKTGVCRLLDAVFREAGFRVFTKTTGSTPFCLDTSGTERLIRRRGPANIGEQLRIIKRAASEHAEVLIIECMAVAPTLQRASQEQIVKGNFNVITNVRYDHVFEMGDTLGEIAESLSGTVPQNGLLLTSDAAYFPYFEKQCKKAHSRAVLCTPKLLPKEQACADLFRIPQDNLAIAYAAAKELGLSDEAFLRCLQGYREDFGAQKLYHTKSGALFYSLFSANDPTSTKAAVDALLSCLSASGESDFSCAPSGSAHSADAPSESGSAGLPSECRCPKFLYNHRTDRPDRLLLFARHFFPQFPASSVYVTGENTAFAVRYLKKHGVPQAERLKDPEALLCGAGPGDGLYIGIGNIKGSAYRLLQKLEEDEWALRHDEAGSKPTETDEAETGLQK